MNKRKLINKVNRLAINLYKLAHAKPNCDVNLLLVAVRLHQAMADYSTGQETSFATMCTLKMRFAILTMHLCRNDVGRKVIKQIAHIRRSIS